MLYICIVGTHQTGSTRLFNLVRFIYESKGLRVHSCWDYKGLYDNSNEYDVIINKVHDTDYDNLSKYDIVLLPIRHLIDAAISLNVKSKWPYLKSCMSNINLYNKFEDKCNFIFRYEDYSHNYIQHFSSKILNIKLTTSIVNEIMDNLENMLKNKNIVKQADYSCPEFSKTLLCREHNTSNGASNKYKLLPTNLLNELLDNKEVSEFLKKTNYSCK